MSGVDDPITAETSAQLGNYTRYEVTFTRGEGVQLFDAGGEAYLDMLCGIGVTTLGHAHPAVLEAVSAQSARLLHTSSLFWTEPAERLARRLVELTFAEKVFFCNSGTEANEAAIKLARSHAGRQGRQAHEIVVLSDAFHGRTMGALSATPQEDKQRPFAPLVPGFKVVANDDPEALRAAVDDDTCAVLLEPVQGEGGVQVISDELLLAAREACDAVGALLIFDEVQCGIGRTGTLFAHQQTPVVPDVMTSAKALGSGLPIGAMLVAEGCADALPPGSHGSTFGGNPVACAAALATLETVADDDFLTRVVDLGGYLKEALKPFGRVSGRGLMIGLDIDPELDAPGIVRSMLYEQRVIINATGPTTLRLLPPLIARSEHADRTVAALEAVLAAAAAQ